ncbi:MAG TPA: SpoIIE family protein phosphatase [Flavobacteriales bacterium]|nr:SpoIIE family protein phosphatase [Flavobacteriales bacterium]
MARIAALILFLVTNVFGTYALNRDSLIAVTKSSKHSDSAKTFTYCVLFADARPTEKLKVDNWYKQAIKMARANKDLRQLGELHKSYAEYYRFKLNDYASSFRYINLAIDAFVEGHRNVELMYAYHFLARDIFERLGLVDEAIDAMKRCCHYAKTGRASELYFRLYELGWYETVNDLAQEGFQHLRESYRIVKPGDPLQMELLIWMGNSFSRRHDYQTALLYIMKAARYADSVHAIVPKFDSYRYAAYCHRELGNKDTAYAYMKRATNFYIENKDYDRIHYLGAELLNWYVKDKNLAEAKKMVDLLIDTTHFNFKSQEELRSAVDMSLYKYYLATGDYKKGIVYLNDYLETEDSVKSRNERLNLGEQNLRLNFLKEREIQRLKQKQKESEERARADIQKKKIWLLIAGVGLAIILLIFSVRNTRQRKAAYKEISHQKKEVETQKQLVETRNKEVMDSIRYAKRIQNALLAHKENLNEFIPQNFIYFKPKDIVSGDFYWTTKISSGRDKFYLGVCDSTGHGVPGAFMSLLNIGFLSEAINEKDIYDPGKVLDHVRTRLIKTISTEGQKDGFDGVLMCYDPTKLTITYTGANIAPYHVSGGKITRLAYDRIPVGKSDVLKPFNVHTLTVQKGDCIYITTDGFIDQFGGDKGRKFMSANLEKLLIENYHLPMQEQMHLLDKAFVDWKGDFEQIDDVCVVGFTV